MKTIDIKETEEYSLFEGLTLYERLEELIGPEKTKHLTELFGGKVVYIPREPLDGHWLVRAVGWEAANKLAEHFRTEFLDQRVTIPKGIHHQAGYYESDIAEMSDKGITANEIAGRFNIHVRTVYRLRHRIYKKRARRFGRTIIGLYSDGATVTEISEKVGFTKDCVSAIISIIRSGEVKLPGVST